jgi:hypothetical protein
MDLYIFKYWCIRAKFTSAAKSRNLTALTGGMKACSIPFPDTAEPKKRLALSLLAKAEI